MTDHSLKNFSLLRRVEIPEINATLVELVHDKTNAAVMHIETNDDENLFNLSLQTLPKTSNGVAHILEHTVLCGSKKFPVRDPFFSMNRRSLNTFMNAFTGADFTCYPAATQVKKDFYNLLGVYCDAVFHPLLSTLSFSQEGHRLEFVGDKLTIKGVVYNEMKGALSSPDTRLTEALMEAIFPDLTYGVNSGGDPKEIPLLTYEELLQFHREYYHPSRCLFFFYGNLPLQGHLDFIEKNVLENAEPLPPLPMLPKQRRFEKKREKKLFYPIAKEEEIEEKTSVAFGWLTTSILDQEEILALNVLDLVLMGTDAAPLKMALLKSNLCKQADSSLEDELSEVPYFLVCKGCHEDAAPKLEKVVRGALEKCASSPFSKELVEGAIHQLELGRKEISVPYGLTLYFRSALLKQHGGDPVDGLKIHTLFRTLREKVQNPDYLPSLIRKHLLDNTHQVQIVMVPNLDLQKKEQEEEEKRIQEIGANLQRSDVEKIRKENVELKKLQEKKESLDVLPKIALTDAPQEGKEFPLQSEKFNSFSVVTHPCFTNELLYADLVFDLPPLDLAEIPYLRLFSLFLSQVGCGGRDYKANLDMLFEHTGGIGVDLDFGCLAEDPTLSLPTLSLRGKAIDRKGDKLFTLFREFIESAEFSDEERIDELLMQHYEEMEHTIQTSPLRFAMLLGVSGFSEPLKLRNMLYGMGYFSELKKIVKEFHTDPSFLIKKLDEMREKCLGLGESTLVLGCHDELVKELKEKRFFGLDKMPFKPSVPWKVTGKPKISTSEGRIIASPVAFNTFSFPVVSYTHPQSAHLSVASKIMENKTLHKRIREQGGAYGSGASNVPMSGYFYFYSYRDPHLSATKKAFEEGVEGLAQGDFEEEDLEDAKLGIIQELDSPIAPGHRAFTAYERLRTGRTPELRQKYRERLKNATKEEIVRSAKEILRPNFAKGVLISFGAEEILQEENIPLFPI